MTSTTDILNGVLNEVLNASDITAGLSLGASVYAALHYNLPGGLGAAQTINELGTTPTVTGYGNYARIGIVRDVTGWTISTLNENAQNAGNLSFPQRSSAAGSGDAIATHISIGTAASGAGTILFQSPLIANGAFWHPCIADSAGNSFGSGFTADDVLVAIIGAPSLPSDGDPYEVMQLYDDGLPSILASTTRYYVKSASQSAAASSKLWKLALTTTAGGGGAAVNFANSTPAAFQMIKAAPLTILVNQIPTVSAGNLLIDVSG